MDTDDTGLCFPRVAIPGNLGYWLAPSSGQDCMDKIEMKLMKSLRSIELFCGLFEKELFNSHS